MTVKENLILGGYILKSKDKKLILKRRSKRFTIYFQGLKREKPAERNSFRR